MVGVNVSFVGFTGPIRDLVRAVRKLERMGVDSVSIPDDLYLRGPLPRRWPILLSTATE